MDKLQFLQTLEARIMSVASAQGLSKNKLLLNAGMSKGLFDSMKKGQIPSIEKICILADYLDVSLDYLTGRTRNPNSHKNTVSALPALVRLPLMASSASAGTGTVLLDDPADSIEVDLSVYPKADFAVRIAGDSMQPLFHDADIVLVHKQPSLLTNQIGIFMLNGEGYIKKYALSRDGSAVTLVSLNPKYSVITVSPDDDLRVCGRVLYTL